MQGNVVRVLEQAEFLDMKIIVKLPVEDVGQFVLPCSLRSLQEVLPVFDQSLGADSVTSQRDVYEGFACLIPVDISVLSAMRTLRSLCIVPSKCYTVVIATMDELGFHPRHLFQALGQPRPKMAFMLLTWRHV
jgi:hypothetical protein